MARTRLLTCFVALAAFSVVSQARVAAAADTVVQVPVDSVIDGRTVSTVANGVIVPWTAKQGVDGDGNADGFVTNAAEAILKTQGKTVGGMLGVALPDDGLFPADARHPAIQLHFSNAAPTAAPQTHQVYISQGLQSFQFNVPAATYSKMFLLITTSEGAANLTITLNYSGGTAPTVTMLKLPDYGIGGAAANDAVFFNLIAGMRKWTSTNQEGDGPSHTITGIELAPSPTATLTSIQVAKTNGSHVVFWGATGIATSPVEVGTGGGSNGGASGVAGAAGASGNGGASGAATSAAGAANGGSSGATSATGGAPASAGSTATGVSGAAPVGQAGSSASGASGLPVSNADNSNGCSCTLIGSTQRRGQSAAFLASSLAIAGLALRRRRARK